MKSYLYIYYFFLRKGEKKNQKNFFKEKSLKGAAWKWPPQVPLERTVVRLSLGAGACLTGVGRREGAGLAGVRWGKLGWPPRKM